MYLLTALALHKKWMKVQLISQSPINVKIKSNNKVWTKRKKMYLSGNIFQFELTRSDMRQQFIFHKVKNSWTKWIWIQTLITHSIYFKATSVIQKSIFMVIHTYLVSYECSRKTMEVFHKRRPHVYTHVGDSINLSQIDQLKAIESLRAKKSKPYKTLPHAIRIENVVYIEV